MKIAASVDVGRLFAGLGTRTVPYGIPHMQLAEVGLVRCEVGLVSCEGTREPAARPPI